MAKSRKKASGRLVRSRAETGADISFVGAAIKDAVEAIEQTARNLPVGSAAERRLVKSAVLALKLTAKATRLHCGPMWFFLPK